VRFEFWALRESLAATRADPQPTRRYVRTSCLIHARKRARLSLAEDLLALVDHFLSVLREPERSWFGAIPDGDREWLAKSMLPGDE
jgi:hypothetical protein